MSAHFWPHISILCLCAGFLAGLATGRAERVRLVQTVKSLLNLLVLKRAADGARAELESFLAAATSTECGCDECAKREVVQ